MTPKRRIPRYSDCINVLLECGDHVIVGVAAIFQGSTIECVWHTEHGRQKWIRFDVSPEGYNWKCKTRLCHREHTYSDMFLSCTVSARSHAARGHKVQVRADDFVGLEINLPTLLDDEPGF